MVKRIECTIIESRLQGCPKSVPPRLDTPKTDPDLSGPTRKSPAFDKDPDVYGPRGEKRKISYGLVLDFTA